MICFLLLLVITFGLYLGVGIISELTENDVIHKEEAGEEKIVLLLHKLIQNKQYYFQFTYFVTTLLHVFLGIVVFLHLKSYIEKEWLCILGSVLFFTIVFFLCIYFPEKIGQMYGLKVYNRNTEEEILSMVNEGHEKGDIESSEVLMISNIFELGDKVAKDIMINRSNMLSLDGNTKLEDAIDYMLKNQYSRYPVYEENVDSIIGILYLKDALRLHAKENLMNKSIKSIRKLLREPFYIPETKKIDDIFKIMQAQKVQLAIVIDEYGQTAGLISMEDILEEIVGNILDEYDVEQQHIREKSETEYIIDGHTRLEELKETLGIDFYTEFETLNGFMISNLEHIPKENEKFVCEYEGYKFSILKVKNRKIESVLVEKIMSVEAEDEKTTIEDEIK